MFIILQVYFLGIVNDSKTKIHVSDLDVIHRLLVIDQISQCRVYNMSVQGRIQDLIRGGGPPDRDRPKTAILGPQFCRILVLGPHFWWSGGGPGPPPGSAPAV